MMPLAMLLQATQIEPLPEEAAATATELGDAATAAAAAIPTGNGPKSTGGCNRATTGSRSRR